MVLTRTSNRARSAHSRRSPCEGMERVSRCALQRGPPGTGGEGGPGRASALSNAGAIASERSGERLRASPLCAEEGPAAHKRSSSARRGAGRICSSAMPLSCAPTRSWWVSNPCSASILATRAISGTAPARRWARARTQRARQPSSLLSRTGVNRGRGAPLRHCLCGEDADPRPRAPLAERALYAAWYARHRVAPRGRPRRRSGQRGHPHETTALFAGVSPIAPAGGFAAAPPQMYKRTAAMPNA